MGPGENIAEAAQNVKDLTIIDGQNVKDLTIIDDLLNERWSMFREKRFRKLDFDIKLLVSRVFNCF